MATTLEKEKEELLKQLEEAKSVNVNNQLLIDEYKEKNDTLSGLVGKYQAYIEENEELKEKFTYERERLQSRVSEISDHAQKLEDKVKELKQNIEVLKQGHEIELERMAEKKDYE